MFSVLLRLYLFGNKWSANTIQPQHFCSQFNFFFFFFTLLKLSSTSNQTVNSLWHPSCGRFSSHNNHVAHNLSTSVSTALSALLIPNEGMQQQQRRWGQEDTPSCGFLWSMLNNTPRDFQSVVCMLTWSVWKEGRWAHKMSHCENRDTLGVFYTHQSIFFSLSKPPHQQNNLDFPLLKHNLHTTAEGKQEVHAQQINMC